MKSFACESEGKPRVPSLRYAPVGMTILWENRKRNRRDLLFLFRLSRRLKNLPLWHFPRPTEFEQREILFKDLRG
jgi:hypothetical protein